MSPFPAEPLNTASSGSMSGKWAAPVQPTPEPDTGGGVEALALVIGCQNHEPDYGVCVECVAAAERVKDSDWLADRLAEAWDSGYDMGDPYQRRGNPGEGKQANPYRAARTAPLQDAEEVGE